MNNKILIGVLLGLLALWGISKFMADGEGTFNPEIISVDSASVDKIVLNAKADNFAEAVIQKSNDGWMISRNGKHYPAMEEAINRMLSELKSVSTTQIVSKSPEKWAQYELDEGQASRFMAYSGEKKLTDFFIGKLNINPQTNQISSYFRLASQPEVYLVEGMKGMTLGQGANSYRVKLAMQMSDPAITEVNVQGDVGYHVVKQPDGEWILDGDAIIEAKKVNNYLINIRSMSGETFIDDFDPNVERDKLLKTLTLKGDNLPGDVIVRCWKDEARGKPFIINSNLFPDSYFASDSTRLFTRLFKPIWEW